MDLSTLGARASTEVMALLGGDMGQLVPVLRKSLVSMFLHGGWLHIGGNMLFLWVFGDNVEDNFGSLAYVVFYLLCGFGAVLAQALLTPTSPIPAIGASGAISGVLAAYLLLYPGASVRALLFIFIFFTVVRVPSLAGDHPLVRPAAAERPGQPDRDGDHDRRRGLWRAYRRLCGRAGADDLLPPIATTAALCVV